MIPPVPYALRLPLAWVVIGAAVAILVAGELISEALAALARWIVPEREARGE